jgi:hypothetical protein
VETVHVEMACIYRELRVRSSRDLGLLLGRLINDSLLDLMEMMHTEKGISSIGPTNELNITGVFTILL